MLDKGLARKYPNYAGRRTRALLAKTALPPAKSPVPQPKRCYDSWEVILNDLGKSGLSLWSQANPESIDPYQRSRLDKASKY